MSLLRLMLRTSTVSALLKQDYDTASPTIAGEAVFDSRIEDIEFQNDQIEVPLIIVYTDEDNGEILDRGNGHGNFLRTIEVRIDIAVGSFQKTIANDQTRVTYALPTTDPELEAVLDLFEAQVWRALYAVDRPASQAWFSLVKRIESWRSIPERSVEGNNRLAARRLYLNCVVSNDCMPLVSTSSPPKGDQPVPEVPSAPWLNPMIGTLAKDPMYSGLVDILRGRGTAYLPRFKRLGVALDSVDHTDPQLLAALKRTTGPDGRPEIVATWVVPE